MADKYLTFRKIKKRIKKRHIKHRKDIFDYCVRYKKFRISIKNI